VETNTRLFTFKGGRDKPEFGGHTNQVYSIAVSSDGRFLASGGMDNKIRIWDAQNNKLLDTFSGHRDFITVLCCVLFPNKAISLTYIFRACLSDLARTNFSQPQTIEQ
jgi:ribosomal RNA-processing protein 9